MTYQGIAHVIVGAVLKAVIIRDESLRWDPTDEAFDAWTFAVDFALLCAFSILSWFFAVLMGRANFFASAVSSGRDVTCNQAPSSSGQSQAGESWGKPLAHRSEEWWFFMSLGSSALLVMSVAFVSAPVSIARGQISGLTTLVIALVVVVACHEMLHFVVLPRAMRQKATLELHLGLGGFVVSINGEISQRRLLLVQFAPLVLMTVVPVLVATIFAEPASWLLLIATLNALLSGADLVSGSMLIKQVPWNAVVRLEGNSGEWRGDRAMGTR